LWETLFPEGISLVDIRDIRPGMKVLKVVGLLPDSVPLHSMPLVNGFQAREIRKRIPEGRDCHSVIACR
jgi:hypothetical protein